MAVTLVIFGSDARGQEPSPVAKANGLASTKIVVPVDTTIPLVLKNTINTRTATVGQAIYCETIYPITVGNRIVIPEGSYVKGSVTQVVRAGHVKGKAQLGLRFDSITLPSGVTRPLRATLSGFGSTGNERFSKKESKIQGESTKGQDARKIAKSTAAGAAVGTISGAIWNNVGRGLEAGSAAGAAEGVIWVLMTKPKEVVLPSGTNLELQLAVPLSFEDYEVEPPSRYQNGPALPRREPNT